MIIIFKKKEATEGYEKEIGDQFRNDPTLYATDTVNAVEHVLNRNCAYPSVILFIILNALFTRIFANNSIFYKFFY